MSPSTILVKEGTVVRIKLVEGDGEQQTEIKNRLAQAHIIVNTPRIDVTEMTGGPAIDFYYEVGQNGMHESVIIPGRQVGQDEVELPESKSVGSFSARRYEISEVSESEVTEFQARGGHFSYTRQ